jgi:transcriptional regulator ATRX
MVSLSGWWNQFLEEDDDLENLELGSKMILLMDILKECELLGDKVLVFSQSLLSLDLIEAFLAKANEANEENALRQDESSAPVSYMGQWRSGVDYFRMDGSTNPDLRKKWCDYFNKVSQP